MYAPTYVTRCDRRFTNVRIRPESSWLALREWTVAGGRAGRRGTEVGAGSLRRTLQARRSPSLIALVLLFLLIHLLPGDPLAR